MRASAESADLAVVMDRRGRLDRQVQVVEVAARQDPQALQGRLDPLDPRVSQALEAPDPRARAVVQAPQERPVLSDRQGLAVVVASALELSIEFQSSPPRRQLAIQRSPTMQHKVLSPSLRGSFRSTRTWQARPAITVRSSARLRE
jgi:hypothetical protein